MTGLCRRGWHRWTFVSMTPPREVTVPPHTSWVCTLVERCERCNVSRTRAHAPVPKRVKVAVGR